MRIAVSGTHFIGKTTLIQDIIKNHPTYECEGEAYEKLVEYQEVHIDIMPSFEICLDLLSYSIQQINDNRDKENIIFDRCPIDFLVYGLCVLEEEQIDPLNSEITELFSDIISVLQGIDLILFLPITDKQNLKYTEENPAFRQQADFYFKRIYRDDLYHLFPAYNQPRIVEIFGSREERMQDINLYLKQNP